MHENVNQNCPQHCLSPNTERQDIYNEKSSQDIEQCKTVEGTGSRSASNTVNGRHYFHRPNKRRSQVGGVGLVERVDAYKSHRRVLEQQILVVHC